MSFDVIENERFNAALALIADLDTQNAVHLTRGHQLGTMTQLEILKNAAGELLELADSARAGDGQELEEFGDTLACLLHFAFRRGWSLGDIGSEIVRKLPLRFGIPAKRGVGAEVSQAS